MKKRKKDNRLVLRKKEMKKEKERKKTIIDQTKILRHAERQKENR